MPHCWEGVDLWLVDSVAVPASLHDVDGRFLHVNAGGERASGLSSAELRGRLYTELLPPQARPAVEAHFRRAVEHGEPADFETAFVDAAGHLRGVRAQHLPLRDGDEIVGVLILAYDVRQPPTRPLRREPPPHLTPRQREVLDLIAAGRSTAEIATELGLSTETVRNHIRSVFRELRVHARPEAIAAARQLGLLAALPLGPQDDEAADVH